MMKQLVLFAGLFFAILSFASAQSSPAGVWKTIDDNTGEAKSHVRIYEQDGAYYGKIIKLLQREPDAVCKECKGDKKNEPLMGMVIMEDLQLHNDYWKKGTIMDPENGNEYGCSIWFEGEKKDELKVRGKHWTGLYRTQTWYRVE